MEKEVMLLCFLHVLVSYWKISHWIYSLKIFSISSWKLPRAENFKNVFLQNSRIRCIIKIFSKPIYRRKKGYELKKFFFQNTTKWVNVKLTFLLVLEKTGISRAISFNKRRKRKTRAYVSQPMSTLLYTPLPFITRTSLRNSMNFEKTSHVFTSSFLKNFTQTYEAQRWERR